MNESEIIVFENNDDPPKVMNYYRDDKSRGIYKIRIKVMHSLAHPNGGVFVYRIEMNGKSVVYATDTEGYVGGDQRLVNFCARSDTSDS